MDINKKFDIPKTIDTNRLVNTLNNSKIATENNALYQTIKGLITDLSQTQADTSASLKTINTVIASGSTGGGGGTVPGSGITQLDGEVLAGPGSGIQVAELSTTGVTPGVYGNVTNVARVTVDTKGRITNIVNVPISSSIAFDYVVMSDGGIPVPSPINDGFGNFIYIPYVP